ncbi:MAG: putative DNA binding domain-containing protein [Muribaculaceae bacterium]|nr:putative DNA binding domain-containing protein [Muribaculaceae bacterium]
MRFDIAKLIGETTDYDKKRELEIRRPKSWCKSVCAFANGSGGSLIFGIADDDTIVGVEDAHTTGEKFSEIVKQKIDPIPPFYFNYEVIDGKTIMIVTVEPGDQTPYYYIGDGQQIAYYRMGNESIPATAIKIRELVLRGTNRSFDSLSTDYKFENYDFSRLRSVFHSRTGKEFTENDYESWGIVDRNGKLTNAGALIANESPIRHSRLFCTRWNGLDQSHGMMEALDDEEISGSLINQLQEGLAFVRRNSRKMWHKSPDGRVELPDYPEDSVLEGLVNALIHRSYLEIGSEVHLDMFDDRIEIFSPGGMYENRPVQECDIMQIKSRRRNPVLADIFSRLKYMERRGSGFKKICNEYGHQVNYRDEIRPIFYSDNQDFVLTLYNLNYGLPQSSPKFPKVPPKEENLTSNVSSNVLKCPQSSEIADTDLHQTAPNCTKLHQLDSGLNYNLKSFLKIVRNFPGASAVSLAIEANISERTVKNYLKKLQELEIIRRIGTNRKGYWEIIKSSNDNQEIEES